MKVVALQAELPEQLAFPDDLLYFLVAVVIDVTYFYRAFLDEVQFLL